MKYNAVITTLMNATKQLTLFSYWSICAMFVFQKSAKIIKPIPIMSV